MYNNQFPKAIVKGYESLIEKMTNHSQKQKISILTPDEFLISYTNKNHRYFANFIDTLKTQRSYLTNPTVSAKEYLAMLDGAGQGIAKTARACRKFANKI